MTYHTYKIPVTQKEYEQIEKAARQKGLKKSAYIRMLLQEARSIQENYCRSGIYISYCEESERRTIYLYTNVQDELHDFFLNMAVRLRLKPGKIAQIYLSDMLEKEEGK